jgi:hypothetical protein
MSLSSTRRSSHPALRKSSDRRILQQREVKDRCSLLQRIEGPLILGVELVQRLAYLQSIQRYVTEFVVSEDTQLVQRLAYLQCLDAIYSVNR